MAEVKPRAHMQGGLAYTENQCISHATQLFGGGVQEVAMVNRYQLQHRPLHKQSPWQYNLPDTGNSYIDLPGTRVTFTFKITNKDGTPLTAADNVAAINMIGASMIDKVDISIGGRSVSDLQTTHYPYKAYLETLMSYGETAKNSQLRCVEWSVDDPSQYEDFAKYVPKVEKVEEKKNRDGAITQAAAPEVPATNSKNSGYITRRSRAAGSTTMQTVWALHNDFFNMGVLFPPDCKLSVTLTKSSDNFLLCTGHANKQYAIDVIDTYLEVHYINLAQGMHESNLAKLMKEPMRVPM